MDGRDWNLFLQPYEQAVEEMKVKFKTMRVELKIREAYAPIEFVTGRVKRISSILEKAKRLNVPSDKLDTGIEDIAGIRIMCQFVDDIHRVASLIRTRKDLIARIREGLYYKLQGQRLPQLPYDRRISGSNRAWIQNRTRRNSNSHLGDEFLGDDRAFIKL